MLIAYAIYRTGLETKLVSVTREIKKNKNKKDELEAKWGWNAN